MKKNITYLTLSLILFYLVALFSFAVYGHFKTINSTNNAETVWKTP